ncbi:MAG: dicarboxylate/amino acid:cation symporter [Janthinobacterium lividum]
MSQATRILLSLGLGLLLGIVGAAVAPGAALTLSGVTQPIGTAWLHGLQMTIVPLVVSLLVTGIGATAEAARAGRITARAVLMIVVVLWSTTLMAAVVEPLILRVFPLPAGLSTALRSALTHSKPVGTVPGIAAFFDTVVPTNVVAAAAADGFLPLTVFALAFAFATTRLPAEQRAGFVAFFQAMVDTLLILIGWVLRLAPIGVGALAFGVGARTGTAAFGALVHYIACVSAIGFLVILAGYPVGAIGGRVGLGRFARAVAPAQAVAISTQSSLASLPAMIEASAGLGAGRGVAGITLPLSVAIFRATSPAMNLSVALYIAHWLGVPIGPAQLAAGVATAAVTTMSSVSLPGTISFVASVAPVAIAMGVPIEPLGILIAVETIPDLFRTVGNVTMDVAVTVTVAARTKADAD